MTLLKILVAIPWAAATVVKRLCIGALILMGAPVVGAVYFFGKWGVGLCVMNITFGLIEDAEAIWKYVTS